MVTWNFNLKAGVDNMKIEVETDECGTWVGVKINGCSVTFKEALKRVLDKKSCEVPKCNEPYKICFDGHTIKFSNVSRCGGTYGDWTFNIDIDCKSFERDNEGATKYLFGETLQSGICNSFNLPGGIFSNCGLETYYLFGKKFKFDKNINDISTFDKVVTEFENRLEKAKQLKGCKKLTFWV